MRKRDGAFLKTIRHLVWIISQIKSTKCRIIFRISNAVFIRSEMPFLKCLQQWNSSIWEVHIANTILITRFIVKICKNVKDFTRIFSAHRGNTYIRIVHICLMKRVILLIALTSLLQGCKSTPTVTSRVITPIGRWSVASASSDTEFHGVELLEDGRARSINLVSVHYEQWMQRGDTLMLSGCSVARNEDSFFTDTMRILTLTHDKLVLKQKEYKWELNRIQE